MNTKPAATTRRPPSQRYSGRSPVLLMNSETTPDDDKMLFHFSLVYNTVKQEFIDMGCVFDDDTNRVCDYPILYQYAVKGNLDYKKYPEYIRSQLNRAYIERLDFIPDVPTENERPRSVNLRKSLRLSGSFAPLQQIQEATAEAPAPVVEAAPAPAPAPAPALASVVEEAPKPTPAPSETIAPIRMPSASSTRIFSRFSLVDV